MEKFDFNAEFFRQWKDVLVNKKKRPYKEVSMDMEKLWAISPEHTLRFTLLVRCLSRNINYYTSYGKYKRKKKGNYKVYGACRPYEGYARLYWIAKKNPKVIYKNLWQLCTIFGQWKDIINLWELDIKMSRHITECSLNQKRMFEVIKDGISNPYYRVEVVRSLPTIRPSTKCRTRHKKSIRIIGKYIRHMMLMNMDWWKSLTGMKQRPHSSSKVYTIVKHMERGNRVLYDKLIHVFTGDEEEFVELMNQKAFKELYIIKHG